MTLFKGRLGIAEARIPHADRHGLLWLNKGNLHVEDGSLHFVAAGSLELPAGDYSIPYQGVSMVLLGPGTTVSHDALRILARHGTLLVAVGDGGVKFYTAPPMGQAHSAIARKHARLWADDTQRLEIARKMYAWRFGVVLPHKDINSLRGIEGSRLKETYRLLATQYGIAWKGRVYDRQNPNAADVPNQAINHAVTFVESAADIAVAAVGALPPLGFIHEDSINAFTLDITDLYRADITLPLAFCVAKKAMSGGNINLEREIRKEAAILFRKQNLIPKMIDRIKELMNASDDHSGA